MPVSRVLNAGFFGTVDDAFSSRSLHIPGSSESLDCITPNSEGLAVTESFNMEVYKIDQSFHLRSNQTKHANVVVWVTVSSVFL